MRAFINLCAVSLTHSFTLSFPHSSPPKERKYIKERKGGLLAPSLTRSLARSLTATPLTLRRYYYFRITKTNKCSLPSSSQMLTHPTGSLARLLTPALTTFETGISDSFRSASFTERTLSRRAVFVCHKWLTKKCAPSHKARSRMFPSSTLATLEIE